MLTLGTLASQLWPDAVGELFRRYAKVRVARAKEILFEEVRVGRVLPEEAAQRDEVAAMLYAWARAVREGAAFENLRLLARVLNEHLDSPPRADSFYRWARMIETLSHSEIVVLAILFREYNRIDPTTKTTVNVDDAMKATRDAAVRRTDLFPVSDEFEQTLVALVRTGLIIQSAGYGGRMNYRPSPLLAELVRMARLNEWAEELSGGADID